MKRKLQILCVALLALVLCNTPLFAEDFEVDGIYYNITSEEDKTVEVTFRGNTYNDVSYEYSGSVTIPESVIYSGNTYSVASIGKGTFYACTDLTSIVIPNSVTSIGDHAFSGCSSLTSVEIPHGVTNIGESAFFECLCLTSVVIPNNVTSIRSCTFFGCSGLTSVEIPNSVTSIGDVAFRSCYGLTSVEIPNSVTSIGDEAFRSCYGLTSVEIPNSVTSIGVGAFSGCSCLSSIEIPNNWTSIEASAFADCTGLTTVVIPNSVTSIGSSAFKNCDRLTSLVIPNSVTSIGDGAFYSCDGFTSLVIPNSVTSIGASAFEGCYGLTSIEISSCVTSIGDDAFKHTRWYNNQPDGVIYLDNYLLRYEGSMPTDTSIKIKEGTLLIADGAFYGCSGLTSIEIPNTVTNIGAAAFTYCSGLTTVEIPKSVTSIGGAAFCGCDGLNSIEIPNSVTNIGADAFVYCSGLTSVVIGTSVISIGESAFSNCKRLTSIQIPNSVTSIGEYAFFNCSGLKSVEIGNNVTIIGGSAFNGCEGLTSVEIPNSVTSIGVAAFDYCLSLTSVEIPNSVTNIGVDAFRDCSNLTTATVGCSWKTNPLYDFGENVTVNATLHSYENGVCTVCGEGEFVEIELVEGTPFENDETREVAKVTYTRTLPNLKWNALYLPVEIPVAELSENYDVAYFNNMHAYDRNDDGTIDEMDMEIFLIKEGTLHANHPYFIRAKSEAAKQLTLELTDVTLYSTDEASCTSITAASAYMNFELIGVYERCEAEELTGCYAINTSGAWSPIALGSYLNPFRFYLKMTSRNGSPVKVDEALKSIRIRLHGEEGTTGIDNMTINCPQTPAIYDLQGRRVSNPGRGMYIVNGKKVMIQ